MLMPADVRNDRLPIMFLILKCGTGVHHDPPDTQVPRQQQPEVSERGTSLIHVDPLHV